MTLIPDPFDDAAPAIVDDEKGTRLAPVVYFAPIGTPLTGALPHPDWHAVGWVTDFGIEDTSAPRD